jgi:hypothetical protein
MTLPNFNQPPNAGVAPSPLAQIMSATSGVVPVQLLDVVALDGTSYHWASCPLTSVAPVLTGNAPTWATLEGITNWDQTYLPWLLTAGPFHLARSLQADIGDFIIQNLSGNSVARDLSTIVTASTFEGALFVYREWNLEAQQVEFEFHGRLSIVAISEQQAEFAAEQLFNGSNYPAPDRLYSEICPWVEYSPQCAAPSTAPACQQTYVTCQQICRFGGVLNSYAIDMTQTIADVSARAVVRARQV